MTSRTASLKFVGPALALFALWMAATYVLEGRILTFLRPEAAGARLAYAVVANLVIGILGAGIVLRRFIHAGATASSLGIRRGSAVVRGVAAGVFLGAGIFALQRPPGLDPTVLLNGFSQTLVVSAAEVMVCWAAVAGAFISSSTPNPPRARIAIAWCTSAVLFGLYHYAHSPPFNTLPMVALLIGIGLVTGAFFLVTREIYGTVVFHNFLALLGVTRALADSGRLSDYATVKIPLIVMALAAVVVLVVVDRFVVRPEGADGSHDTRITEK